MSLSAGDATFVPDCSGMSLASVGDVPMCSVRVVWRRAMARLPSLEEGHGQTAKWRLGPPSDTGPRE